MKDIISGQKKSYYSSVTSLLERCEDVVVEEIEIRSARVQVQTINRISDVLCIPSDVIQSCLLFSSPNVKENSSDDTANVSSAAECIGSPLKLQSCVDYSHVERNITESSDKVRLGHKDKQQFIPLAAKLARECLSAVMLSGACLTRPVLCLCNPTESKDRTVAIGCYVHDGTTHMIDISYEEITPDVFRVKFNKLLKEQQRLSIPACDHVMTHASAEYRLFTDSSSIALDSSSEGTKVSPTSSTVTIRVEWSNINGLLMNPPAECMATLNIQVVCGDKSSVVYSLYEELQYLKELTAGLSQGKINWPEVVHTISPLERVKKLLYSQSYVDEEDTEGNTSPLEQRRNLDFTDRFWSILIECQSYVELLDTIKYVMDSVSTKRCNPLMVSSSNRNPLAKWIHSQQLGESDGSLDLGSLQAIAYFIEMGVEKLTKDYIHAYLGNFSGLVTVDKLDRFTRKTVSIQNRLADLTKLHTVLELSSFLHSTIRLPLATVRAATASALKHLSDNESLSEQGFELSTTVASVADMISQDNIEVWRLSLGSGSDKADVRITRSEPKHNIVLPLTSNDDIFYYCVIRQHLLHPDISV